MGYDESLTLLKQSFVGGGEGAFYLDALAHLAHLRHLDWLDVGIGRDGKSLTTFVEHCRSRGQTLDVTGIDPDAEPARYGDDAVSWTIIRGDFESWTSPSVFDVVDADQSLYYMSDLRSAVRRMVEALRLGGLLIATCWSQDDSLCRLRARLCPEAPPTLVAEALDQVFMAQPELALVDRVGFITQVDLSRWQANESVRRAAVQVISRGAPIGDHAKRSADLSRLLHDLPPVVPRNNVAVCLRKIGAR
jgi:SAM-dependent methyltransferase